MKRILIFSLFLSFCASNMFAQKDSIESSYQTRWSFEQRINETMDDLVSYLREMAGAAYRNRDERILALKYEKAVLELFFAGKGETFNIQGVEYKPIITLIDKMGKIVKRLSPKHFCTQIINGPIIPPKFVWCKIRVANFTKEHCKQISSNEYIIDAMVDISYDNNSVNSPKLEGRKVKEIKIMAEHLIADTPNGTKEWLEPRFIDLYAIISE